MDKRTREPFWNTGRDQVREELMSINIQQQTSDLKPLIDTILCSIIVIHVV